MTGSKILLDTNVIIKVFEGDNELANHLAKQKTLYVPTIVLGELYVGINRVSNKSKHLKLLTDFLHIALVLNVNTLTARFYGEIAAQLFRRGKPIPTNDIWIAALAKQHKLKLITYDHHFS